jgi:hypothetical protein
MQATGGKKGFFFNSSSLIRRLKFSTTRNLAQFQHGILTTFIGVCNHADKHFLLLLSISLPTTLHVTMPFSQNDTKILE